MSQIEVFMNELEQEQNTTRRMLERIPDDQYDFQPHKRSMNIRSLATHLAELAGWMPVDCTSQPIIPSTPWL